MLPLIGAGHADDIVRFTRNVVGSVLRSNVLSDAMSRAMAGMGLTAKYRDQCEGKHQRMGQVPHCTRMSGDPQH